MISSNIEVCDRAAFDFDDLSRPVYGLLGIPIDAVDFVQVVTAIKRAASDRRPFLVSTPNVNFLVASQSDAEFRESLLMSDLCPVDGAPVVALARLLGIPVKGRVSGSDTFERLKTDASGQSLKVFFFGGTDEAGALLSQSVDRSEGIQCVGRLNPGFGSVVELSQPTTIQKINDSGADLLAVFLSATKAQKWLLMNHEGLQVPVRFDFGGTINFQAGLVRRAPLWMRHCGLEWVWRIKAEPYLWSRYWIDGCRLIGLGFKHVVPLLIVAQLDRRRTPHALRIVSRVESARAVIELSGDAVAAHVQGAIARFREVVAAEKDVVFDLSGLTNLDQRFLGLLLMFRKCLKSRGRDLAFTGVKKRIEDRFRLNGFAFLLQSRTV